MASVFYPVLVLSIFLALFASQRTQISNTTPLFININASNSASAFIHYCSAVTQDYQSAIPGQTLSGSVSPGGFSASFLAQVGNNISKNASSGQVTMVCYGNLPAGTLANILQQSAGDASFGMVSADGWRSAGQGLSQSAQTLPVVIPQGYIVQLIQIRG